MVLIKAKGFTYQNDKLEKVERFEQIVKEINEIDITKLRIPELRDRLAVRHGRYIEQDADDKKTFKFEREDLGLLVDFWLNFLKKKDIS